MDWLELIWDIASMWALCAACLMIFTAVLRRREEVDVIEKNKKTEVAPSEESEFYATGSGR